jgi:phage-related minor tail protein
MPELPALVQRIKLDSTGFDAAARGIESRFLGIGKSAESALSGVSKGLLGGAAVAGIGVGLFEIGKQFDKAYDKIRIATGATGEKFASLKDSVKDVASQVPSSFGSIGNEIGIINQKLGLTGEPLNHLSETIAHLSHLQKTDLGESTKTITSLFNNWGVATGQQVPLLNELFRVSQHTGVTVADLSTAVATAGPLLRQLGFSVTESASLIGLLNKNGIQTGPVFMALSRAIAASAKEGIPAKQLFQDLLESIKNAPNDTAAASEAIAVFGGRAGPKLAGLIREGKLEYQDLVKVIEGGGDTIQHASKATFDFAENFDIFKNRVLIGLEPIATATFRSVSDGMLAIIPAATVLTDVLGAIQPALGPGLLALAAFAVAGRLLAPLVIGLGESLTTLPLGFISSGEAAQTWAARLTTAGEAVQTVGARLPGLIGTGLLAALTFDGIGKSSQSTAIGVGALTIAGAQLGNAFPVVGTALGAASGFIIGFAKDALTMTDSVKEMNTWLDHLTGTIGNLGAKASAHKFVLDQVVPADGAKRFKEVFTAAETSAEGFDRQITRIASTSPAAAQRIVEGLRDMHAQSGQPLFSEAAFTLLNAALEKGIVKFKEHAVAGQSAKQTDQEVAQAAIDAANGVAAGGTGLAKITDLMKLASKATSDFKSALDLLTGGSLDQESTNLKWVDSLVAVTDSIVKNGTSLDILTEQGRNNRDAILAATQAAETHTEAVFKQTGSIDQANAVMGQHITDLYNTATAAGIAGDEALVYIEDLLGIPPEARTDIHNTADIAAFITQQLIDKYNAIDGRSINTAVNVETSEAMNKLYAVIRLAQQVGTTVQGLGFANDPTQAAHGLVALSRGGVAGQIVNGPRLALIGEGRSREAVVPFDNYGDTVATIRNTGAADLFAQAALAAGGSLPFAAPRSTGGGDGSPVFHTTLVVQGDVHGVDDLAAAFNQMAAQRDRELAGKLRQGRL